MNNKGNGMKIILAVILLAAAVFVILYTSTDIFTGGAKPPSQDTSAAAIEAAKSPDKGSAAKKADAPGTMKADNPNLFKKPGGE